MKKRAAWITVSWVVLGVLGVATMFIAALGGPVKILLLWMAWGLLLTDCVWLGIFTYLRRSRKPAQNIFTGDQRLFQRIKRETGEAAERYLNSVTRRGVRRKSALYERSWFLLCGTPQSGKTSLLRGSGLDFPLRYPSERDGLMVEGSDQVTWYFANEAVWIDTPGSILEDEGRTHWLALIASLQGVRASTPVDGVAIVVSIGDVLTADVQGIKELGKKLRSRLDDLIAQWGIEFPVYLIFNRADQIPGFSEFFSEQSVQGRSQVFGATIPVQVRKAMPRVAFLEEYNLLCKSLTSRRLDELHQERSAQKKRMICRFVIHFEAMQERLGALVAELFKPSSYVGKPLFRGFYFTSCNDKPEESHGKQTAVSDVSLTIARHPLNPNRLAEQSGTERAAGRKERKSLFVLPLFREIMARDKSLVKNTQKRTRREMVRHYALLSTLVLFFLVFAGYLCYARYSSAKLLGEIRRQLTTLPPEQAPLMDQYGSLDIIRTIVARLQRYEDHGVPASMELGFYRGKPILNELRAIYFYRLRRYVVMPSVKYLEFEIQNHAQNDGALSSDSYDSLYSSLKAYLSISEAAVSHPRDIDTVFLRGEMIAAIKNSILATINEDRLPRRLETILEDNMGLFLYYLKRQQFPQVQENQLLVAAARKKLSRLPDGGSLYAAIIGRVFPDAPQLSLDQMLNRQGEGILKSQKKISVLFTQQGWDQVVSDAISQGAKDPFKLDWVLGLPPDEAGGPALDPKKLRGEMIDAYLADYKAQWLTFLGSIYMDPFGDLERSSRILQKLSSERSELQMLLDAVAGYTVIKNQSELQQAGGNALAEAEKLNKGLAGAVQTAEKTESKLPFSFGGGGSPFDNLSASFEPLRSFARSSTGALGGYEGYRDKMNTLAGKLESVAAQGGAQAVVVFAGRDDDPLLDAWKYSQNTLDAMPEDIAAALKNLLMQPVEYAGAAISQVLTVTLNAQWQNEIVKPFASRFSGRFPFSSQGDDASFNDVMEFFRPVTGTYWGFYERRLAPYVVKSDSGWMVRTLGSIRLNFNPELSNSLNAAERIKDIFFEQDGKLRTLDVSVSPGMSNKNNASMDVCGQKIALPPGGKSEHLRWPLDGAQADSAHLRVEISSDFSQDLSFSGQWSFLKLLQAAKINRINGSTFDAKWQVNVQNQYMVYIDTRIQIASTDHPFVDQVFRAFTCPAELLNEPVNANSAALK